MEKLKWWGIQACCLGAVALTGCSGVVDVGGNTGGASGAGGQGVAGDYGFAGAGGAYGFAGGYVVAGAGGAYGIAGASGGGAVPYDPSDEPEGICPATCEDVAGAVLPLQTEQAFYTAIIGRWLICGDGLAVFGGAPADVIGVEYAAPTLVQLPFAPPGLRLSGDMYYLVDGPDGVERGQGFDYQLTYDVSVDSAGNPRPIQLNMHPAPNAGFGGSFRYSPCPRQWELSGGSANPGDEAILVPLD